MSDIKIRARIKGGETEVKCLMSHPMETGLRKDSKTDQLVPAHFIKEVVCKSKDQVVMTASWSGGVSRNPYLSFKFNGGAEGDEVSVTWTDNLGKTETGVGKISA